MQAAQLLFSEDSEDGWQHCTSFPYQSVAFRNAFAVVFHVAVEEQVTSTVHAIEGKP